MNVVFVGQSSSPSEDPAEVIRRHVVQMPIAGSWGEFLPTYERLYAEVAPVIREFDSALGSLLDQLTVLPFGSRHFQVTDQSRNRLLVSLPTHASDQELVGAFQQIYSPLSIHSLPTEAAWHTPKRGDNNSVEFKVAYGAAIPNQRQILLAPSLLNDPPNFAHIALHETSHVALAQPGVSADENRMETHPESVRRELRFNTLLREAVVAGRITGTTPERVDQIRAEREAELARVS